MGEGDVGECDGVGFQNNLGRTKIFQFSLVIKTRKRVWMSIVRTFLVLVVPRLIFLAASNWMDPPKLEILAFLGPSSVKEPCLLYTSPSPRDRQKSRMPSSA